MLHHDLHDLSNLVRVIEVKLTEAITSCVAKTINTVQHGLDFSPLNTDYLEITDSKQQQQQQ